MANSYIAYGLIVLTVAGLIAGFFVARHNSDRRVYHRRRMQERKTRRRG